MGLEEDLAYASDRIPFGDEPQGRDKRGSERGLQTCCVQQAFFGLQRAFGSCSFSISVNGPLGNNEYNLGGRVRLFATEKHTVRDPAAM